MASERPSSRPFVRAGERILTKAELGEKQVCPNCSAKFYDLRKRPATCPKCQTAFDPDEEGVRAKRGRGRVAAYDPAYEDDEEGDGKVKSKAKSGDDDEDEEVEETPEIDAEAVDDPVVVGDDDDDGDTAADDDLPPGFSEEEADLEDDAADDVPLIEDDEEFPEDEIGDLSDEEDDSNR